MSDLTQFTDRYPVIDGFSYNTRLRPNMTFLAMVLDRIEPLRRAGNYRFRAITIPKNSGGYANSRPRRIRVSGKCCTW